MSPDIVWEEGGGGGRGLGERPEQLWLIGEQCSGVSRA